MTDKAAAEKKMPKGGRKGGTRFPRYSLTDCLDWAKKLVSKTHLSAQGKDVVLSGVVDAKSSTGEIRISALKQYGLMEGDSKAYIASDLAKRINSSPEDELIPLRREAFLSATVFKLLFDTFHGDTIPKAKLKQRASTLKVHPDETDACIEVYTAGLITANMGSIQGDLVAHISSAEVSTQPDLNADTDSEIPDAEKKVNDQKAGGEERGGEDEGEPERSHQPPRAVVQVNVTLDSSLDTDKLERQLQLLKRYGAL